MRRKPLDDDKSKKSSPSIVRTKRVRENRIANERQRRSSITAQISAIAKVIPSDYLPIGYTHKDVLCAAHRFIAEKSDEATGKSRESIGTVFEILPRLIQTANGTNGAFTMPENHRGRPLKPAVIVKCDKSMQTETEPASMLIPNTSQNLCYILLQPSTSGQAIPTLVSMPQQFNVQQSKSPTRPLTATASMQTETMHNCSVLTQTDDQMIASIEKNLLKDQESVKFMQDMNKYIESGSTDDLSSPLKSIINVDAIISGAPFDSPSSATIEPRGQGGSSGWPLYEMDETNPPIYPPVAQPAVGGTCCSNNNFSVVNLVDEAMNCGRPYNNTQQQHRDTGNAKRTSIAGHNKRPAECPNHSAYQFNPISIPTAGGGHSSCYLADTTAAESLDAFYEFSITTTLQDADSNSWHQQQPYFMPNYGHHTQQQSMPTATSGHSTFPRRNCTSSTTPTKPATRSGRDKSTGGGGFQIAHMLPEISNARLGPSTSSSSIGHNAFYPTDAMQQQSTCFSSSLSSDFMLPVEMTNPASFSTRPPTQHGIFMPRKL